jgi:hypothetical protein
LCASTRLWMSARVNVSVSSSAWARACSSPSFSRSSLHGQQARGRECRRVCKAHKRLPALAACSKLGATVQHDTRPPTHMHQRTPHTEPPHQIATYHIHTHCCRTHPTTRW